ncbi:MULTISPECIES: STAS domain-containing protein [Microtetraspora]|uniref:Anti-sigma factor antagonist n=1 Tax=Microtetraspora glauca TaxID=1996 RepID=A0ABV3GG94_MICGL|nr:STAS domain-containing protein [Microtetraspora sp. AC03309]MCC5582108.1 STAS domain-containing protein [Microtetraspora sp. AC03309]
MRDFRVSVSPHPPFTVVSVIGELDVLTEPELREQVERTLDREPSCQLLFDLTALRFIDSSGIRVILDCYTRTRGSGGGVTVCGLSPHIQHLFTILGLTVRMNIYPTLAAALSHAVGE